MNKILLTGGGSGGHIFPLIAVAQSIKRQAQKKDIKLELRYFGPDNDYANFIKKEGITTERVASAKFRRYWSLNNFIDFSKLIFSFFQVFFKIKRFRPNICFSKAGPGSLPVVLVCRFLKIPVIIHESDATLSLTNSIAAKFALKILVSFELTQKELAKKDIKNAVVTGNPVRKEIADVIKTDQNYAKQKLGLDPGLPLIVVIGGSLGSTRINKLISDNLDYLTSKYHIFHQVGSANLNQTQTKARKNYHVAAFFNQEYATVLAASDLVISRAGGNIFEIASLGKPSILIPLPESAQNHQKLNASEYSQTGATVMLEENDISNDKFLRTINEILTNSDKQKTMHQAAFNFSKPLAADKIADIILKHLAVE